MLQPLEQKCICPLGAPRQPGMDTAKAALERSTSIRSGRRSTSITQIGCSGPKSILENRVSPATEKIFEGKMIIGVPKEVKDHEARVGIVPSGVKALVD